MPKVAKQEPKPRRRRKTGGSVIDRITKLDDGHDGNISISIYGQSKSGKTTFWSGFPKPILAIICSALDNPGELKSLDTPELRKVVEKVTIKKTDEILEIAKWQEEEQKFATIVLDHASGLQDYNVKEIAGLEEIPVQLSWGIVSQQQWGQIATQMKEKLRALLNLSCNVVIVSQEREFKQAEESEIAAPYIGPAMVPSVTGWLNPAVDYTVQTFKRQKTKTSTTNIGGKDIETVQPIEGVDYCLRVGPHATYTTGFRVPKGSELPDVIVDPTFSKVKKLLKGGR